MSSSKAVQIQEPIKYEDIVWENVKLIINVSKRDSKDPEYKYRKLVIKIEEWLNRTKCHDSDIEDISMTIVDYEFEPGRWNLEIDVTWSQDIGGWNESREWDSEWNFIKQEKLDEPTSIGSTK